MNNKMRCFLFVLVTLTISFFGVEYYGQYALALSCEPLSFQESLESMDVVFLGKVISKQYLPSSQIANATFSVEEVFKNMSEEIVFIIVNEEFWGPVFNKEMQYIVFAYYNDDDDLTIPFCSNTRSFDPVLIKELSFLTSQDIVPPKKQILQGIFSENILCKRGLELILKSADNSPACVKPETTTKLVERGWGKYLE